MTMNLRYDQIFIILLILTKSNYNDDSNERKNTLYSMDSEESFLFCIMVVFLITE